MPHLAHLLSSPERSDELEPHCLVSSSKGTVSFLIPVYVISHCERCLVEVNCLWDFVKHVNDRSSLVLDGKLVKFIVVISTLSRKLYIAGV